MTSTGAQTVPARSTRFRTLYLVQMSAIVLLAGVFIRTALIPSWKTLNTDFPNYYLAARLHMEGVPLDRAYEWDWFQRQKNEHNIDQPLVAYAHPPICALPFLPLAHLSPMPAKRVWIGANLLFLLAIIFLLARTADLSLGRAALVAVACLVPLRVCFLLGQYYVFILLLITASFALYKRERFYASGAILGFAAALKLFPGLLVLVFLKQRNWRALGATIAGFCACTLLSIGIFGWEPHRVFFTEVLPRSLSGDMIDPYSSAWSSWSGLWHRWCLFEPGLNPHPLVNSPLLYAILKALVPVAALFAFWWTASNRTAEERDWQWAVVVTVSLFLSSIPSSYHYVLLVFPMCIAVVHMSRTGSRNGVFLLWAGYLLLSLNIPHFASLRGAPRLAGTTLMFVVLIACCGRLKPTRLGAAIGVIVLLLLAGWSIVSLRGRSAALADRVPITLRSLSLSSPAIASERVAFSTLQENDYQLGLTTGTQTPLIRQGGDVLAVSASPHSPEIYFEVSGVESTIRRLNARGIEDVTQGESPAISPDGARLLFIRESKGRGTLWVRELQSNTEQRFSDDRYDVLEAAFTPKQEIVMAARLQNGPPQIFTVDYPRRVRLLHLTGRVRYPAMSSDGVLLAYSRLEGSSWHLYTRNLRSGTESRLTSGNCNDTQPAWMNEHVILYSSDCARGLGLTAISRIKVTTVQP